MYLSLERENPNEIPIFVKTLSTPTIFIEISTSVHGLKEKIRDMEGIELNQQRLIFAGKQLEKDRTLELYGILKVTYGPSC